MPIISCTSQLVTSDLWKFSKQSQGESQYGCQTAKMLILMSFYHEKWALRKVCEWDDGVITAAS